MKKKQRCLIKRFSALVAALMLSFALAVPCFAAEASMPTEDDFFSHPFSWYVWRTHSLMGYQGYELICSPLVFGSDGYVTSGFSFSSSVNQRIFYDASNSNNYYQYGFPSLIEPVGTCGSWRYYPSFPLGTRGQPYSLLLAYAGSSSVVGAYGACVPSPESLYLSNFASNGRNNEYGLPVPSFSQDIYPVVRGPYRTGNTFANDWVIFSGLDNSCVRPSKSNANRFGPYFSPVVTGGYLAWGVTDWQNPDARFPLTYNFPSTDARIWLVTESTKTSTLTGSLAYTLFVPKHLLPSDIEVGDWISQGSMDKLQDQLVNDFDVDSGTLKNSKDNLNSWSSTSSIDVDVASTAAELVYNLFQNLGTFLFSLSLLCFGAVVIRMLIKKAVN